jgi:DNA primase
MSAERLGVLVGDAASEKPADGARATASSPAATRSNLVRQAISLMLHYPQVAAENVDRTALANVEKPGVTLITELLEDLRSHPQLTTAGLLERWRDRDECSHLTRLAAQEMLVLEEAAAAVFRDTVESLIRQEGPDRRTETLLAKASAGGLTADEKQELRELLGQRQGAAAVAGNES